MRKLGLLCFLILVGWAIYGIITAPIFRISKIEIEGANFVPKEQAVEQLSHLKGQHLLQLLLSGKSKKQLQKEHPPIVSIKLKLQLPNTVRVILKEKKEWVSYLTNQSNYIVAGDGTILNKRAKNPTITDLDQLIIIRGLKDDQFQNDKIDIKLIQKTRSIVSNIRYYFPYKNLQIEFIDNNHLVLIKDDTLPIKIGSLENLEEKFRNLMYFFRRYPEKVPKLDYIDLRIKDRIVVKENNA